MPKKIDYVVVAPTGGRDNGSGDDTPEEEAAGGPGADTANPRTWKARRTGSTGTAERGETTAKWRRATGRRFYKTGPGNNAARPGSADSRVVVIDLARQRRLPRPQAAQAQVRRHAGLEQRAGRPGY